MKIKFLKNQRISILLAAVMVLAGMPETYVRAEGIEQAVSMAEPIENVAEKQVPVYRLEKKGEASDYTELGFFGDSSAIRREITLQAGESLAIHFEGPVSNMLMYLSAQPSSAA